MKKIIEFGDGKDVYGRIEIAGEYIIAVPKIVEEIEELTEKYIKENQDDYNIDNLYSYLKKNGIKFDILPEADYIIHF